MLVDDPPGVPISMHAHRCAHPETDRLSGSLWSSAKLVEAMTEGEVATHGNIEIARLTIDWPVPCVKPRLL
jgi:hypothetical protein